MIVKSREKPHKLSLIELAWRYLPNGDSYEEYMREQIRRRRAGYAGELRGDSEWSLLDISDPHYLLHDVELLVGGITYQLDTVFICPKFVLVVEMKNIAGEVNFDKEKHQFTRMKENEFPVGMVNPVDQLDKHKRVLRRILRTNHPIEGAVVFAFSSTIIGSTVPGVNIIHLSGLQSLLDNLYEKHPKELLTTLQARKLAEFLASIHSPKKDTITSLIPMNVYTRLIKGVTCVNCDRTVMSYEWKTWICPRCGLRDKEAHIRALRDYCLLYGETITNKQFREFTGVESISTASRLLNDMNFKFTGNYRNRTYRIDLK